MIDSYQLIIVGGGPAGLTAAVYAGRSQIKTLLISDQLGGAINWAHKIQNFPGYIEISGQDLAEKMISQSEKWGAKVIIDQVVAIKNNKDFLEIQTKDNKIYKAENLLLALGTEKRKLDITNEERFIGRGLSYCALCDGQFFKNKIVAVCGSGDAAATTAIYLSNLAEKVYLVVRKIDLKCNPSWRKAIQGTKNIDIICQYQIDSLIGQEKLAGLRLKNTNQEIKELTVEGLFVEIGSIPASLLAQQIKLNLDPEGFIIVDQQGRTSQPNIWAAGDMTTGSNKLGQIITASAEGAIAADSIYQKIQQKN
jgi:thioredoxin reductase (NADPH)